MSENGQMRGEPRVKISRTVLNEEGPKKKNLQIKHAPCEGCGDEPGIEFAEGHVDTTLVTENESNKSEKGKLIIRCKACQNEFDNRKKNSKTILDLRESIWKIDEVLASSSDYGLTSDQVKTLNKEREYCVGEIRKAFATEEEVQEFIGQ